MVKLVALVEVLKEVQRLQAVLDIFHFSSLFPYQVMVHSLLGFLQRGHGLIGILLQIPHVSFSHRCRGAFIIYS